MGILSFLRFFLTHLQKNNGCIHVFNFLCEELVNQKVTKNDFNRGVVKMKIPASQYFAGISCRTGRY